MDDYTSDRALHASLRIASSTELTSSGRPWVPGPWSRGPKTGPHRNAPIYVYDGEDTIVADTDDELIADYIAHFHPKRAKALVEEILRLRSQLESRAKDDCAETCDACRDSGVDLGSNFCSRCGADR